MIDLSCVRDEYFPDRLATALGKLDGAEFGDDLWVIFAPPGDVD